jgi:myo-inositol-1(or 4)-monophosphatase
MWKKEMEVARRAAEEAGKILKGLFGQVKKIEKKGSIDLVTEADLLSENTILNIIARHFPRDSVLTEEAGALNQLPERVWIIDPLDGTTNYAHAFPFFAISIAMEFEKECVLGVVYNPYTGEFFEAMKGSGARLNGKRIHVSQTNELKDSLLVTGFPYDVHENPQGVMECFQKMLVRAQGVRRPGSAALDLCYVASGVFDGFWEERLHPWDTAAGAVIVQEAGGIVTTFGSDSYTPHLPSIVAANPFIHKAMVEALNAPL